MKKSEQFLYLLYTPEGILDDIVLLIASNPTGWNEPYTFRSFKNPFSTHFPESNSPLRCCSKLEKNYNTNKQKFIKQSYTKDMNIVEFLNTSVTRDSKTNLRKKPTIKKMAIRKPILIKIRK